MSSKRLRTLTLSTLAVEGITLDGFCEMSKSDTKPATITTEGGTYDVAMNTEIFGTDE